MTKTNSTEREKEDSANTPYNGACAGNDAPQPYCAIRFHANNPHAQDVYKLKNSRSFFLDCHLAMQYVQVKNTRLTMYIYFI